MKHTDNILTGGDGVTGQTGLQVRNNINDQFAVVMGNTEYLPETFVFTTLNLSPFANKIIEVAFQHDLAGANFTLPNNCTLYFNGGALLNAGTITGNSTKIINTKPIQIFSSTTIFAGTWVNTECNYEWFGAKASVSLSDYTNDCGDAINAANESPFKIVPLVGFYYTTKTIIYNKPKTIDFGTSPMEHDDDPVMPIAAIKPDHFRLYTNQQIDLVDIRFSDVFLYGGVLDVKGVGTYHKDVIKVKAETAKILRGCCHVDIVGSYHGNAALGASGKAFHWDTSGNTKYGHLANFTLKGKIRFIPYGIYLDSMVGAYSSTWIGVNYFHVQCDGTKQAYHVESGFSSEFVGYTQNRDVYAYEEQDMYQAEFWTPNILNTFNWDLTARDFQWEAGSGRYTGSRGTMIHCNGMQLVGDSLRSNSIYYSSPLFKPQPAYRVDNQSKVRLLMEKSNRQYFLSELHNALTGFDKFATFTMKAHNGATINFDSPTPVIGSEAETVNITIQRAETILRNYAYATAYTFGGGSNLDKDFIELAFTGSYIYRGTFYISFDGNVPKRLQVITYDASNVATVVSDTLVNGKDGYNSNIVLKQDIPGCNALAIRLIGCATSGGTVYISDVALDTGATRGINLKSTIDDYKYSWSGLLTQSGTSIPTVNEILNTTRQTVTTAYVSVGNYKLICTNRLTVNKTDPVSETAHVYNGTTFVGTVKISRTNSNEFLIQTWDSSGVLANGILSNQHVSFNVGW